MVVEKGSCRLEQEEEIKRGPGRRANSTGRPGLCAWSVRMDAWRRAALSIHCLCKLMQLCLSLVDSASLQLYILG
jgi:hypothetical protein